MTSLSTNCLTVVMISVWNSVSPSVWASLVMRDPASLLAWSCAIPLRFSLGHARSRFASRLVMCDPASLLAWSCAIPLRFSLGSSSDPVEHGRQALAAADAHRLQAVAGTAPVQFARQRGQHPAAGGADGVPKGNTRTVDV